MQELLAEMKSEMDQDADEVDAGVNQELLAEMKSEMDPDEVDAGSLAEVNAARPEVFILRGSVTRHVAPHSAAAAEGNNPQTPRGRIIPQTPPRAAPLQPLHDAPPSVRELLAMSDEGIVAAGGQVSSVDAGIGQVGQSGGQLGSHAARGQVGIVAAGGQVSGVAASGLPQPPTP